MKTISILLHLFKPGMYMAELDIRNAYYSVSIHEDHQSLLKFYYQTSLLKFTVLPNGHTERARNFTKFLKHLTFSRKIEKILVAGFFDNLITMGKIHSFCCDNILKITLLFSKLGGFAIHPEKSTFNPC